MSSSKIIAPLPILFCKICWINYDYQKCSFSISCQIYPLIPMLLKSKTRKPSNTWHKDYQVHVHHLHTIVQDYPLLNNLEEEVLSNYPFWVTIIFLHFSFGSPILHLPMIWWSLQRNQQCIQIRYWLMMPMWHIKPLCITAPIPTPAPPLSDCVLHLILLK